MCSRQQAQPSVMTRVPLPHPVFRNHLPGMTVHGCTRTCLEKGTRRYPAPPFRRLSRCPPRRPRSWRRAATTSSPTAATAGTKTMNGCPRPMRSPSRPASAPHGRKRARQNYGRRRQQAPSSETEGAIGELFRRSRWRSWLAVRPTPGPAELDSSISVVPDPLQLVSASMRRWQP